MLISLMIFLAGNLFTSIWDFEIPSLWQCFRQHNYGHTHGYRPLSTLWCHTVMHTVKEMAL